MYTPNDPSDEKFFWVPYKYVYILLLVHVYAFYMVSYTFWSMYLHFRTQFALFYFSTMCEEMIIAEKGNPQIEFKMTHS